MQQTRSKKWSEMEKFVCVWFGETMRFWKFALRLPSSARIVRNYSNFIKFPDTFSFRNLSTLFYLRRDVSYFRGPLNSSRNPTFKSIVMEMISICIQNRIFIVFLFLYFFEKICSSNYFNLEIPRFVKTKRFKLLAFDLSNLLMELTPRISQSQCLLRLQDTS